MRALLFVFLGGGAGSVLRFAVSEGYKRLWPFGGFPLATLLINLLGCFLIGWFSQMITKDLGYERFLLIAGFCGGFTTFSAFSAEGLELYRTGQSAILLLYVLLSIAGGIFAVYAGVKAAGF